MTKRMHGFDSGCQYIQKCLLATYLLTVKVDSCLKAYSHVTCTALLLLKDLIPCCAGNVCADEPQN